MSTLVIGIGNPDRGDDAAGLRVVEMLRETPIPGARLVTVTGDMLRLLDSFADADSAVLIDAMHTGAVAGSVVRFDASSAQIKNDLESFASSHAFNLAETIELARSLNRLPPRLVVFGIEAADFTLGNDLSAAVAGAVAAVAERIREECTCTKHL